MIRSTSHTLKFTNKNKQLLIKDFLYEYRALLQQLINFIWDNEIPGFNLNIQKSKHLNNCPRMLPNDFLKQFDSPFTARMNQCVGKQACSMIRSALKKRSKQLYVLKKKQRECESVKYLQSKIDRQPLVKPRAHNANAELDSRFTDFEVGNNEFDLFIRIKTIGPNYKPIIIPIKHTKVSKKWMKIGAMKNSIRLSGQNLHLLFDAPDNPKKKGATVGCDQGILTTASLSDGQVTRPCPHGHTLKSIQNKLTKRTKNSKGFHRTQEHRKNYINWSLNQLNFSNISELRLEKIKQIRHKSKTSRYLQHWKYTLIKQKLISLSEIEGFKLVEVPNEFRSQRCSKCGWVRKANRKGKTFKCRQCGFTLDSDLNAASNLKLDLFKVPFWVRSQKLNHQGFFWAKDGLYSESHERIVRDAKESKNI